MFARSSTFRDRPADLDAGIAYVRDEVMPALQAMDGCIGLSMLVDRESGAGIVTSAWASEAAMRASEQAVGPLRDRAAERFGSRPEVQEWEIALLHRVRTTGDGACARVTWTQTEPGMVEQQLDLFRTSVLPQLEDLPGFCSVSVMVDRRTGMGALAATYESRQAMEDSRDAAAGLRTESTQKVRAEIVDVAEFEVALAHLRVPETV